jgi:hypothetical protein
MAGGVRRAALCAVTLGAVLFAAAGCVRTYLPEAPVVSRSPAPVGGSCSASPTGLPGLGVTPDGSTPGAYGATPGGGLPTAGAQPGAGAPTTGAPGAGGGETGAPGAGGGETDGPVPPTATAPPYPTGTYRPPGGTTGTPGTGLPTGGIGTPNPGVPGETGCPSTSPAPSQPGTGLPPGPGTTIPLPTGTGPIGGAPAPAVTACPAYAPSDRTILTLAALKATDGLPTGTTVAARRCADEYLVADLSAPKVGTIRVVLQHGTGGWHAVAVGSYPCHALSTAPPAARNLLDCN